MCRNVGDFGREIWGWRDLGGKFEAPQAPPEEIREVGEFEAPAAPLGGKYGTPQGPLGPEIWGVPSDGGGFSLPTLR